MGEGEALILPEGTVAEGAVGPLTDLNHRSAVKLLERTESSEMSCTVTSTLTGTGFEDGL